ncbi:YkgJ family cysteine cluster protein [Archaeoglobus veneficus]|uniref:YkgJ family cysteine cluster protein n=1 Tax=Archaeoglobus veneficus (strain DSM 11195 / SNP6) TaxID=693661 RepID=F2KMJ7_ARCVS|nr:YkgJ family cysteine cluster protein [Archaeoglobus veneficus]AEA47194.1 protein of unknown function UPF0153 [Archaeoglobus veneficus SNP6]
MIIDNSRKLTFDDKFRFSCHKEIRCFNRCCHDLNIFLTPYDILRIKRNLGLSSDEFLEKYTRWHVGPETGLPVVVLKMVDGKCPFVTDDGCSIYRDRPGACRLYPLVRMRSRNEEYYYIIVENFCEGFNENKEWTIREWLDDQGAWKYNEMNDVFMELVLGLYSSGRKLSNEEMQKFYMACYDIDRFREFARENGIADNETLEDDEKLVEFGINWLKQTLLSV